MKPFTIVAVLVLAILTVGCQIGPVKLTLETPTPGSPGELVYNAPIGLSVDVGSFVPGTDIKYVGSSDKGAQILIGDQIAYKQRADSIDWRGSPVADVDLEINSRVAWFNEQALNVAGTARIVVKNVVPQAAPVGNAPIEYRAPVGYSIPRGGFIPGTRISYVGSTEDQGAELGGVEGWPYRQMVDSILWEGKLKDNVTLRLDVRVVRFDEESLEVGGLATIGIVP